MLEKLENWAIRNYGFESHRTQAVFWITYILRGFK